MIYHPYYRGETDDYAYVGTIDFVSREGDFTEYYLSLIVKDDIVTKIESIIEVRNLSTSEVYPFYSLENTLTVLGVPDKMYIIPAGRPTQSPDTYSIFLYYMDEAIEYEIFSFSLEKINNEYTICPDNGSNENHEINLRIYSNEADMTDEINRYVKYNQDVANGFYMPFEEVTGISIDDFYLSIINIDNYCFTIKGEI